jgi:hypothetical protein
MLSIGEKKIMSRVVQEFNRKSLFSPKSVDEIFKKLEIPEKYKSGNLTKTKCATLRFGKSVDFI